MNMNEYDERAALEQALKASMENPVFSSDPAKREEEELAFALKLSQEQSSMHASEEDAVKAAIALSMDDAANMKAVQELEAQKVSKEMQIEEIPLPANLVPNFKKLVFNFEMELGIKIYVVFDGATCYKIRVVGYDSDVMAIACAFLESVVQEPIQLEAKLDGLKAQRVHVFIDYSNIFIGSQFMVKGVPAAMGRGRARESIVKDLSIRLRYPALIGLVEGNRNCLERHVFASLDPTHPLWKTWAGLKYAVHTYKRSTGDGEQFVDDANIAMINQAILKYPTPPHPRHTLVLLTGDGNDNDGRASFFSCVSQALEAGWGVELWTWRLNVSRKYLDLLETYGDVGVFKIMYLDLYREDITFKQHSKDGTGGEKKEEDWMVKKSKKRTGGAVMKMVGDIQRKSSFTMQNSSSGLPAPPSNPVPIPAPAHPPVTKMNSNNRFAPIDIISDDESDEDSSEGLGEGEEFFFTCPLSNSILIQPVKLRTCEQYFEREALVSWVKKRGTCPLTGEGVGVGDITEAPADYVSRLEKFRKGMKK